MSRFILKTEGKNIRNFASRNCLIIEGGNTIYNNKRFQRMKTDKTISKQEHYQNELV